MSKITDLAAVGTLHSNDLLIDVDVHDTTMAATGTNKKLTVAQLASSMATLGLLYPCISVPPSGDTTGVTDTAAIQTAINALSPGGMLALPGSLYYVNAPLVINKRIVIEGIDSGFGWNIYASGYPANSQFESHAQTGTVIQAVAAWAQGGAAGAAILLLTTDATHYITEGPVIRNLCLSGTTGTGSGGCVMSNTADGIRAIGAVVDVYIENVVIMFLKGWGINTVADASAPGGFTINTPGTWRVFRVNCYNNNSGGININYVADSVWSDILCVGNQAGPGWQIISPDNSHFIGCRAEWNGADGFHLTGAWTTGAGAVFNNTFTACSTDANTGNGFLIDATDGEGTLSFNGIFCRRDSNVSGGGTAAGFAISQTAAADLSFKVNVRNLMISCTTAAFTAGPHYGLSVTGTGCYLDIDGVSLIGASAPFHTSGPPGKLRWGPSISCFTGTSDAPVAAAAPNAGTITMNGTTAVAVSNTQVTAASQIMLSIQTPAGSGPGLPYVSARTAGTSFSVKSMVAADTSTVAYQISEP